MKLRDIFIFIIAFCVLAVSTQAHADRTNNYYHNEPAQVTYLPTETNTVVVDNTSNSALAGASGQHNYKASYNFQWSVAGFHLMDVDKSAVSFGLAKRLGKVFSTANYSTDGTNSAIGFSFSGTF